MMPLSWTFCPEHLALPPFSRARKRRPFSPIVFTGAHAAGEQNVAANAFRLSHASSAHLNVGLGEKYPTTLGTSRTTSKTESCSAMCRRVGIAVFVWCVGLIVWSVPLAEGLEQASPVNTSLSQSTRGARGEGEELNTTAASPHLNSFETLRKFLRNLVDGSHASMTRTVLEANVSAQCNLGLIKLFRGIRNLEPWVFRRKCPLTRLSEKNIGTCASRWS